MTGRAWRGGSTRAWRVVRTFVLTRDAGQGCRAHREGWCARSGATRPRGAHQCTDGQDVAHHTHGRAVTGDDPAYIIAACAPCNLYIGEPGPPGDPPHRPITNWSTT